jgi:hypothetical protein
MPQEHTFVLDFVFDLLGADLATLAIAPSRLAVRVISRDEFNAEHFPLIC